MKTLRVIYGDGVPEPVGYLITRWGKDPFAFGSYSHVPPFASGDDYDAMFEPVDNVLYFAGEATGREYPATVHGAYLSGIAAAEEIVYSGLDMPQRARARLYLDRLDNHSTPNRKSKTCAELVEAS